MKKFVWSLAGVILLLAGVWALDVAGVRRDVRALMAGADAVAYAEPRLTIAVTAGPPRPRVTPDEAGIDFVSIQQAVDYAASRNTRALLIAQGGHLVFEKYWDGTTLDTPVDLSGFTPVLSALVLGTVMYGDRTVTLDDPLSDYIDAWKDDERGTVTLGELLAGEGGFVRPEGRPWPGSRVARYSVRGDLRAALLDWPRDPKLPAGQTPADVSADVLVLAMESRLGAPYERALATAVWAPLEAGDFSVGHDGSRSSPGRMRAGCCLRARVGDWMRVGELLANEGVFQGNQLMPPDFARQLLRPTRKDSAVGFFTRVDGQFATRDVVRLESPGKQRLWVVPSLRLAILRIGAEPPESAGWDEAMIPDSIIRGTRGWQPAGAGDGVDPSRFAPH